MSGSSVVSARFVTITVLCISVISLNFVLLAPAIAAAGSDSEIQAAFLTKIPLFVRWPKSAFTDAEAPIVTCALDAPEIARSLEGAAREAKVKGRDFEIRRIDEAAQAAGCHIIVIGAGARDAQRALARQLRNKGQLTVATSRYFAEDGGMVGMEMFEGRIAFEVNNHVAKSADLIISSRLLKLASYVH